MATMDSARWERIQALFHQAAELPPFEQRGFLDGACRGDETLLAAVVAMLDEDARAGSILDSGVEHAAQQVLDLTAAVPTAQGDFGPYRLLEVLGEGGMGVVYRAERHDLGSIVAIKILRDAWLSPARRERFASEQRLLAQLNHPSIARLYDADTLADGTPWFAMEYVAGVALTDYCRANASPLPERLQLFRDVCDAVQHAHQQLVVHRDLKPSNILVTPDGRVKLLDFGISKQLDTLDHADQTKTLLRLMTPAYAAPEQIRGERVGIHADVYALGVVMYELLTGRVPYDVSTHTPSEAESLIVRGDAERPSVAAAQHTGDVNAGSWVHAVGRTARGDLDILCLTAMHADPARRYQSVEALVRDIDHYLAGEPLEARRDTLAYRAGKFARRHWRPIAAAAVVVTALAGMAAFYTLRLAEARNAAFSEAARTQLIQRFLVRLFQGDDEAAGPAEDLRVLTLIDRGVLQARSLDADPLMQAELYRTLGTIYQQLGKFDRADALLKQALERRRALLGPEDPAVADSLVALGQLRDGQAAYDDAERLIREGLDKARAALGPTHAAVAKATTALGQVLENRGAYADAVKVLEEAVRLHSQPGGNQADAAEALTELANTHFYMGHYNQSESLNRQVLAIERRMYGDSHPYVADTLINLGAIQFERGRYGEAERFDREALEIIRAWHGKDHPATASALTMVGRAIVQQGERYGEATAVLREALTIQERDMGPVHPRVASALNELGNVALRQNRLDEAEAHFGRAIAIYRQVYEDKHYVIGVIQSNLATVYQEREEFDRARQQFAEVLHRYTETLPAGHQLFGIARVRLGRVLTRASRFDEAERELLAGYEILKKQSNPPTRWIESAREDLVKVYEATKRPDKAASFVAQTATPRP